MNHAIRLFLAVIGCIVPMVLYAQTPEQELVLPHALFDQPSLSTPRSLASAEHAINDENLLIVEASIERDRTGENFEIYQHEGGYFVPLGFLTQLLEFPIEVDAHLGEAHGWFIRQNRIFQIDMNRKEVIVEGKKMRYDPTLVHRSYGEIYVDKSLFSQWFPIDMELTFSDLILTLKPRESLPFQERLKRDKLRKKIRTITREEKRYPIVPTPYKAASIPLVNATVGANYNSTSNKTLVPYSVLASGDIGYVNNNTFISGSGNSTDLLQSFRTTFSRKDYNKNLLGAAHASDISMGDINSVALPMVTRSSLSRGVYISNYDINRNNKFDSRDFIGDAQPDWEVELYRNGVLLGSLVVPSTGRYEFLDIPVLFGNNSFRLVFYGPQGEVYEKTETTYIDDSFVNKGNVQYQLAVSEKSKTLFRVDERDRTINHKRGTRSSFNLDYGLTKTTTLTTGLVSTPLEDGRFHQYQLAGIRQSLGNVLASVNSVYDYADKSWATELNATTSINDISISLEQQFMNNFVSEEHLATQRLRQRYSAASINGVWSHWLPTGISYTLRGDHESLEDDQSITSLSNRLSTQMFGLSFANSLDWRKNAIANSTSHNTSGSFSIRGRYNKILLRSTLDYSIRPEYELRTVNVSGQKRIARDMSIQATIRKNLSNARTTSLNAALNKSFDHYRISTFMQADDGGEYAFGTTLSLSLGHDPFANTTHIQERPMANYGAVSARAFLDKNRNNIFDADDELLPGVSFRNDNRLVKGNGIDPVFIPYVQPDSPANITVEQSTIEDPFWVPVPEGRTLVSRQGLVTPIDFPVVITTEIDGVIYLDRGDEPRSTAGVTIELVDASTGTIVRTTRSEFDGFYLFQKITSGTYFLRINKDDLTRMKATQDRRIKLVIPEGSDIISNQDFVIPTIYTNASDATG